MNDLICKAIDLSDGLQFSELRSLMEQAQGVLESTESGPKNLAACRDEIGRLLSGSSQHPKKYESFFLAIATDHAVLRGLHGDLDHDLVLSLFFGTTQEKEASFSLLEVLSKTSQRRFVTMPADHPDINDFDLEDIISPESFGEQLEEALEDTQLYKDLDVAETWTEAYKIVRNYLNEHSYDPGLKSLMEEFVRSELYAFYPNGVELEGLTALTLRLEILKNFVNSEKRIPGLEDIAVDKVVADLKLLISLVYKNNKATRALIALEMQGKIDAYVTALVAMAKNRFASFHSGSSMGVAEYQDWRNLLRALESVVKDNSALHQELKELTAWVEIYFLREPKYWEEISAESSMALFTAADLNPYRNYVLDFQSFVSSVFSVAKCQEFLSLSEAQCQGAAMAMGVRPVFSRSGKQIQEWMQKNNINGFSLNDLNDRLFDQSELKACVPLKVSKDDPKKVDNRSLITLLSAAFNLQRKLFQLKHAGKSISSNQLVALRVCRDELAKVFGVNPSLKTASNFSWDFPLADDDPLRQTVFRGLSTNSGDSGKSDAQNLCSAITGFLDQVERENRGAADAGLQPAEL